MPTILISLWCKASYVWSFLCFVLALADGLCCDWLVYPIGCWYRCPEIRTSYIDSAQLSRFYLKMATECTLRNAVFLNKNRTMDNVQKHNICINVSSSQTFRSYLKSQMLETLRETEKGHSRVECPLESPENLIIPICRCSPHRSLSTLIHITATEITIS
jgi:hypothetical protein